MPVHEVSLADEKAQSTSNTQVIGNTVQRYENFMAHRPTPTIDEGLANKALDFKLKIGNEFCWSIHKETLTEKSTFFKNALESFEVDAVKALTSTNADTTSGRYRQFCHLTPRRAFLRSSHDAIRLLWLLSYWCRRVLYA